MRVLQLFLSLILLTTTCFGQYLKPLPGMQFVNRTHKHARGLVAYWPMNERSGNKVFDSSGNNNTGTFQGTAPTWTSGKHGSAVLLPGDDEYIDFDAHVSKVANLSKGTIGLYIKINSASGTGIVFSASDIADASSDISFHFSGGTTDLNFFIREDGAFLSGATFQTILTPFIIGQWHYIFATQDGTTIRLYKDAVLIHSEPSSAWFNSVTGLDTLRFGNRQDSGGNELSANVTFGHAVIYNRALSAGEIAEHYAKPFGMLQKDNTALIASAEAPPPPTGGQVIMIQMSMIPLFLIFTLVCFIRGKEIGK